MERFIRYVRASFYVPFASRLAQDGITVDAAAANAAVRRWLREVADARVHATTKAVPAERLAVERAMLQSIPAPYGGEIVRSDPRPTPVPIVGLQHPLSIYDELMLPGAAR